MNSLKNMSIITVLIFSVLFSLINICSGEDKAVKKYQEEIVYPKHYPNKFNGMGHIDRISRNEIVIDDSLFSLSPHVTYSTKGKRHASKAWLKVGSFIGYKTDSNNKIVSIWLIK